VIDAVRCAAEIQRGMAERNAGTPPEKWIELRNGINLGDVIAEEHDIFGDGMNLATRLGHPGRVVCEPSPKVKQTICHIVSVSSFGGTGRGLQPRIDLNTNSANCALAQPKSLRVKCFGLWGAYDSCT